MELFKARKNKGKVTQEAEERAERISGIMLGEIPGTPGLISGKKDR